jgi:CRP/FNR family transcriptional regulator
MLNKLFEKTLKIYIPVDWIPLLKNYTSTRNHTKNERIFNEGDEVKGIFFINEGMVKVVSHYDATNERILRLSSSGDFLGHRAISSESYPVSAIALTDVEVTFIPIDFFLLLLKSNPEFSLYIINFLTNDLKKSEDLMKSMIHNEVIIRAGILICMLIDAFGYDPKTPKKLNYTLARKDMANMGVTTYETIIRNLAKLEEMKIIKLTNKEIYVLNEGALRKLVSVKNRT